MITAYHRPIRKEDALFLFARPNINTVGVLGSTQFGVIDGQELEAVDLQELGSDEVDITNDRINIGGFASLNKLIESKIIFVAIKDAIKQEFTANQNNLNSLSGVLYNTGGQSVIAAVIQACDVQVTTFAKEEKYPIGDWLLLKNNPEHAILEKIDIDSSVQVKYQTISKSPLSLPMVTVAAARWKTGRTRVVIGGELFEAPITVIDGPSDIGDEESIKKAYSHNPSQKTIQNEYFINTTIVLLKRILSDMEEGR